MTSPSPLPRYRSPLPRYRSPLRRSGSPLSGRTPGTRRGALRAVALTLVLVATGFGLSVPAAAGDGPVYRDAHASPQRRAADLIRRMTTDEKIGQLQQIALSRIQGDCYWSGGNFNDTCVQQVFGDEHTGSILSGGGMAPPTNTPREWALMTNAIQRYALEHSRLKIPNVYGADAVHGHANVLGATIFPHQIGLSASWDLELARATAESTRRAAAATGVLWNFAPVADVARDLRWGRYYETYGEDPLLAGQLAAASVAAMQERSDVRPVAASVKHFAGYSEPGNGHDRVASDFSARYLQDTILPAYKAAVQAGAWTVMVNSGAVNGIPATGSRYLLTDVLRRQWHFDGVVVSDWADVRSLLTAYHIAADYPGAIAAAVNAGVDMAMVSPDDHGFIAAAREAVGKGMISRERLDQAVTRILVLKFRLGLFERPYVDPEAADAAVLGADRDLARRAATESLVLLRNGSNALPFGPTVRNIVVTGPNADSLPNQLGGWTIGWQGVPNGVTVPGTTILKGLIDGAPAGTTVLSVPDRDAAVPATRSADAAVVVLGENAGAEGWLDSPRPELPADQQALVTALQGTGKPVVVVIVASRPLAWLPGSEGGNAVADVLYGRANPSGRLTVSWPRHIGNDPLYYQRLPGTNGHEESFYDAAYRFGAGLSYTTYTMNSLTVVKPSLSAKDTVKLTVRVANTGPRAGELVVPVYVGRPVSTVLVPGRGLVAFARVSLAAGQTRDVDLSFPASRLAVTTGDVDGGGPQRVLPGGYALTAGAGSGAPTATFTIG